MLVGISVYVQGIVWDISIHEEKCYVNPDNYIIMVSLFVFFSLLLRQVSRILLCSLFRTIWI
jgi:hypothetical protein